MRDKDRPGFSRSAFRHGREGSPLPHRPRPRTRGAGHMPRLAPRTSFSVVGLYPGAARGRGISCRPEIYPPRSCL